jgi:hypothetical protein
MLRVSRIIVSCHVFLIVGEYCAGRRRRRRRIKGEDG